MIPRIPSLLFLSALTVSAVGCIPISPNDPPPEGSGVACGDGLCMLGEGAVSCPKDCLAEASLDVQLDACRGSLGVADLDEQTAIVASFTRSAAHLDESGDRLGGLVSSASSVLVSLAFQPNESTLPKEIGFDGHGTYRAKSARVDFTASFLFGEDYQAGKKGSVIEPSLFPAESYLVGAKVGFSDSGAVVSYAQPGPLVELLGFGANPPNPFTMGLDQATTEMYKQRLRFAMSAADQLGAISSSATLEGEISLVPGTFSPATLDAKAENPRLGQKVEILKSELAQGNQGLSGKVRLAVHGGAFEYFATFDARVGQRPSLVLTCTP